MKKIKLNNHQKMEQLFLLYESKMYSVAYAILRNVELAEDVVQDSFLKLANYLDKIKDVNADKTKYLALKIVKTTAINVYRRNKKEQSLFLYQDDQEIEDPLNLIDSKVISIYSHEILDSILINMPDIYKDIIKMHYFYELSLSEIAEITGIQPATIRKRHERAKKYILERIGGHKDEKKTENYITEFRKNDI